MNTTPGARPRIPDWVAKMDAGQWYRISGDAPDLGLPPTSAGTRFLRDTDPARDLSLNPPRNLKEIARRMLGRDPIAPWSGHSGFSSMTEAWNGAVYASRAGRSGSMVLFGGGHDDYYGSSVHAFDLDDRRWRRLTDGFVSARAGDYGQGAIYPQATYPDGSPLPPHTYDYVQYDEIGNDFLLAKGQVELGKNVTAISIPHLFNLETRGWRHGPLHESAVLNAGGFSTWDSRRRLLWVHSGDDGGGNAFVAFSPDGVNPDATAGHWTRMLAPRLPGESNHCAMQYHPGLDLVLLASHYRNSLEVIDPAVPDAPLRRMSSSGQVPTFREYAALEFAPASESLVCYSACDGPRVYAARCEAGAHWRVFGEHSDCDPIADAARQSRYNANIEHTFGRFRIAHFDSFDLAILVRHIDSPVYAMRVPG